MRLMTTAADVPPLQLTPQTRFQENYRIATAVNAGSDVVALRNGRGDVELFTVGSDNTLWNFYPDPGSDTGYSGVSTGLQSGAMSAGVDVSGNIVLFTAINLQLWYVVETIGAGSSRWSAPVRLDVPQPSGATTIAALRTRQIAGRLYVAVLTKLANAGGAVYNLAYSIWDSTNPLFNATPVRFATTNCVWLGQSAQNAAFACVDGIIASYSVATTTVSQFPMAAPFQSLSVDVAADNTGNDQIVAVLADGNAYRLTGGANNQPYSWSQLSQNMTFRQIAAATDDSGAALLFAVAGDNRIYHWQPMTTSPSGYSNPPVAIATGAALLALAANDAGNIDLFSVGTAHNTLSHVFQEEQSTRWVAEALEVPSNGEVERYISYTTDLTFADADGARLGDLPVTVSASEQTRVTINGATYFIDPDKPARLSTNTAGILSIAQETGSLAIPDLQMTIPSMMAPGQSIALAQSTATQARLADVQGADLMNATVADGSFLLGEQYRTQTTTDSLAAAFRQCMSLPDTPPASPALLSRNAQLHHGVWNRNGGSATDLTRRIAPATEQHWQLSFDGPEVSYRTLTRDDAAALIAFKRAALPDAFGFFDWLEDVGDFFEGVADGFINVVDTVVTTIGNTVNAVFTFVVDGVTAIYEAVVTTVEQAFGIVEAFLAQVKVFFEMVFEWLGFLFDWPDMVRTHTAFVYAVNQLLGFLQGAAGGMQRVIDNGIHDVQGRLATLFNDAVKNIAGTASVGGYEQAHAQSSPDFNSATSNTVIGNAMLDNAGAARSAAGGALLAAIDSGPFDQYLQLLEQFATNTEAGAAFASALSYFQNLGGSLDQIFSQLLSGMLQVVQGILQSALAGVQVLVDGLFQLMQTVLAALQAILNEEWNIPFVSQLYSFITGGSTLTTLDLVALLVAVPTTILYKIAHDSAPFPDDASVTAFESSFDAQSLLRASGLGASGTRVVNEELTTLDPPPSPWAMILNTGTAVFTFFYGLFSAYIDSQEEAAPLASKWAFVLELGVQACSCPWLTSSAGPDCSTEDGSAATLWIYECFGCALDAYFLKETNAITENASDRGVVISFVYACGQLIVSIVASLKADAATIANYIVSCIPPLSKILLLSSIVESTGGTSRAVVAFIDVTFLATSAILTSLSPTDAVTEPILITA